MEWFKSNLELLVRARYPAIQIVSWEEGRAVRLLEGVAAKTGKSLRLWSRTSGFEREARKVEEALPLDALDKIVQGADRCFYGMLDFHPFLDDPAVVRRLREVIAQVRASYKTVFLIGPVAKVPVELEKDLTLLDLPLPVRSEVAAALDGLVAGVKDRLNIHLGAELRERMIEAALGLTLDEIQCIYAKALLNDQKLTESDLDLILFEKEQIIRKTGLLEYIHVHESFGSVGGLPRLKTWLDRRGHAFHEKARAFGLPNPKGLMLLGVQGCGKSLVAKAIAAAWKFPLVRLDMGALFSSYVGSSEANMRRAIQLAESLAPVVLWMDEIDKGLSGAQGNANDGGVTRRLVGTFLTWMQEKTSPVFVMATANAIEHLPPELLRKGRFDEIFFVDLPEAAARQEIFAIHIARRGRQPKAFDTQGLAARSEGFSGAEIEQAVISGLFEAFHQGRDLATGDIEKALAETVPLSVTSAESIEALRRWAATRTVNAA